ncbi:unnamed protein product [Gongylonema pulchrum]|uniref:Serine/threonine-protein kinase RIO1 n=1 Tax=Gongylonema pulchrum TaxID=637853 RepID=A0A3P7NA76_9BILA|nr:unnamed protein product [Gongylonema pulchrum]
MPDLGEQWNQKLTEAIERRPLCRDRSDRATAQQVLDKRTLLVLRRLLQRGVFESIEGCLSTGKEANIYHAKTESGKSIAVKVYKTSILIFRDRDRYVTGEYRYRHGYCKGNPRKMVTVWAEKEMRNLSRMHSAGLPVPEPKIVKQNVLVMDFIGSDGWPAPLLKASVLSVRDLFRLVADPSVSSQEESAETPADDALFMNAFIAQRLEQVLHFGRDQQIEKEGGEIPNPFQTMILQVKHNKDDDIEKVSIWSMLCRDCYVRFRIEAFTKHF